MSLPHLKRLLHYKRNSILITLRSRVVFSKGLRLFQMYFQDTVLLRTVQELLDFLSQLSCGIVLGYIILYVNFISIPGLESFEYGITRLGIDFSLPFDKFREFVFLITTCYRSKTFLVGPSFNLLPNFPWSHLLPYF